MRRPKEERGDAARTVVSDELLDRCRAGDEGAWAELVRTTHREVYTLCLRILADPTEAAEATQDAYLKVWRGLASFRGDALFTTWLYRVATNAAISKMRSRNRRRAREQTWDSEAMSAMAGSASTEAEAAARIDARDLERALETLPEHYRAAVVLRDVYGLGIEELATQLKISQTAAKVRVHRGRKMLKEKVFPAVDEVGL